MQLFLAQKSFDAFLVSGKEWRMSFVCVLLTKQIKFVVRNEILSGMVGADLVGFQV